MLIDWTAGDLKGTTQIQVEEHLKKCNRCRVKSIQYQAQRSIIIQTALELDDGLNNHGLGLTLIV